VGEPGRRVVKALVPKLRAQWGLHMVIANGENSAGGSGITVTTASEIFGAGVDVITSGDHLWDQKEVMQLLANEPIVGLVFIERANHVIAITPCVRPRLIHFEPVRFREPHHVEPMPGPTFAEARRGQHVIDQCLIVVRVIADFLRRWWKAQRYKIDAAHECDRVRLRCGFQSVQPRLHECIYRIPRTGSRRSRDIPDRLKSPMLLGCAAHQRERTKQHRKPREHDAVKQFCAEEAMWLVTRATKLLQSCVTHVPRARFATPLLLACPC